MLDVYATVVIIDNGCILLVRRVGSQVWELPGRRVAHGISAARTAICTMRQKTGLHVTLTRLVGVYDYPYWPVSGYGVVFTALPTQCILRAQGHNGNEVRYFARSALPARLVWWHRRPIEDAFNGVGRHSWMRLMR